MHSRGNEHFQTMGINSTAEKKKRKPSSMLGRRGTKGKGGKFTADDAQVKKIFITVTIPSADLATPKRNNAQLHRGGEGG